MVPKEVKDKVNNIQFITELVKARSVLPSGASVVNEESGVSYFTQHVAEVCEQLTVSVRALQTGG